MSHLCLSKRKKKRFSSTVDNVNLWVPSRSVRLYSTFDVSHRAKLSPLTRCISVENAVPRQTDIFKRDLVSLNGIIKSVSNIFNNN